MKDKRKMLLIILFIIILIETTVIVLFQFTEVFENKENVNDETEITKENDIEENVSESKNNTEKEDEYPIVFRYSIEENYEIDKVDRGTYNSELQKYINKEYKPLLDISLNIDKEYDDKALLYIEETAYETAEFDRGFESMLDRYNDFGVEKLKLNVDNDGARKLNEELENIYNTYIEESIVDFDPIYKDESVFLGYEYRIIKDRILVLKLEREIVAGMGGYLIYPQIFHYDLVDNKILSNSELLDLLNISETRIINLLKEKYLSLDESYKHLEGWYYGAITRKVFDIDELMMILESDDDLNLYIFLQFSNEEESWDVTYENIIIDFDE